MGPASRTRRAWRGRGLGARGGGGPGRWSSCSGGGGRRLPAASAAASGCPSPRSGHCFLFLLSDTDSHAGKRKHLLSDAAATSSSEGSSQPLSLQNDGAGAGRRTACASGPRLSPASRSLAGPRPALAARLPLGRSGPRPSGRPGPLSRALLGRSQPLGPLGLPLWPRRPPRAAPCPSASLPVCSSP